MANRNLLNAPLLRINGKLDALGCSLSACTVKSVHGVLTPIAPSSANEKGISQLFAMLDCSIEDTV
jgi:hypothetical protein